jgi:hypothetical protein
MRWPMSMYGVLFLVDRYMGWPMHGVFLVDDTGFTGNYQPQTTPTNTDTRRRERYGLTLRDRVSSVSVSDSHAEGERRRALGDVELERQRTVCETAYSEMSLPTPCHVTTASTASPTMGTQFAMLRVASATTPMRTPTWPPATVTRTWSSATRTGLVCTRPPR